MEKSFPKYALFCASLLLLFGCIRPRYFTTPQDTVYQLADYEIALRHWGMHDEIHQRFISLADGYAVYLGWEVRQAFINAVRDRLNPRLESLDKIVERNIRQFENGHEFYLGLYCYQKEWCRLSGEDPVWNLTLENNRGVKMRPLLVEEVDISPDQAWMFPEEMTTGKTIFRVVFPKTDPADQPIIDSQTSFFILKCHSLLGKLEFKWKLEPIPDKFK
ncbi:MAG: hypothetical protein WBM02_09115 [bacterium]